MAVREYGKACQRALSGPGSPEAALRTPIEGLLHVVADRLGVDLVFFPETVPDGVPARADYAVRTGGAINGHLEVKSPQTDIDPAKLRGHNLRQWERLRDLPNLLYTNGRSWALYRSGERVGEAEQLDGDPRTAGRRLAVHDGGFERLLADFLTWHPVPIRSVRHLTRTIAPRCRLLRREVLDQLASEAESLDGAAPTKVNPFTSLATDWRIVLFPNSTDEEFADGYAQAVVFALLLARSEGIALAERGLHEIGDELGHRYSVMATALQMLTDPLARISPGFETILGLVAREVAVVDWPCIRGGSTDPYPQLYETFLDLYDHRLRQSSGSYYTPSEVVDEMVRLVDAVLTTRLGYRLGLASEEVTVLDPAMGTGTFLHSVIHRVADTVGDTYGEGAIAAALTELTGRLIGFESQMGPFAVAEMRAAEMLKRYGADVPGTGLRFFLTNTLDDPYAPPGHVFSQFAPLAMSRREANEVKAEERVTVYLGNPPYGEKALRLGNWVRAGSGGHAALLDAYRSPGDERLHYVLQNLYVYFFSFGTWKLYDAHPDHRHGVLALITAAGYLRGPGFRGMREYLRRTCDEGWIIDLSPEGMRPEVATRVFPSVQQPLAIALLVRRRPDDPLHTGPDRAARIWYTALHGTREKKFAQLGDLTLDGIQWRPVRDDWSAPLTPASESTWDDWPALGDLMPWSLPGVKANRRWVYAPHPQILDRRWNTLIHAGSSRRRRELFKETDRTVATTAEPLPDGHQHIGTIDTERGRCPEPRRVAYRSFDRQWLIPDSRLIDRPRPNLWRASAGNTFINEQHGRQLRSGPGIVLTRLIPEMDHFKGSEGGRVLPARHATGEPNVAPGLLELLATRLPDRGPSTVEDLVAYLAGVVAHRGYTARFGEELVTPGIRVPLTSDSELWRQAVSIGRRVVALHAYEGVEADPLALAPVTGPPKTIRYDPARQELHVGSGTFGPVPPAVWEYDVGGMPVVHKWLSYRKAEPGGRRSSELDRIHLDAWPLAWTVELTELLTVLRHLVELEPAQASLLASILAGPLLTVPELLAAGVLPIPDAARRARRAGPDLFNPGP